MHNERTTRPNRGPDDRPDLDPEPESEPAQGTLPLTEMQGGRDNVTPVEPRSRVTDPRSSRLAARALKASGGHASQCARVLAALRSAPGATSPEISAVLGGDRYLPSRRLPDLERGGLVRRGDLRPCRATARPCLTWWPVSAGGA